MCWPPSTSIDFFHKVGLPTVNLKLVRPCPLATADETFQVLQEACLETEKAALQDVGEGYVMYLTSKSGNNEEDHVVHLGKMKSADYRLLRRMRDRAKVFAQRAGSMLVEDIVEEYKAEASSAGLGHELVATRADTLSRLCRLVFSEDCPATCLVLSLRCTCQSIATMGLPMNTNLKS